MSFTASNDRIIVSDANDLVVFDTDRKMPAITSVVSGTFNLSSRGTGQSQTVVNHLLANIQYNPEFVLAVASISGSASYPWVGTMFNSSGSTITNLSWGFTSGAWRLGAARAITFEVINNQLFLREEYFNVNPTLAIAAVSLEYKAYLGSYA
jgi:hypothetical protein